MVSSVPFNREKYEKAKTAYRLIDKVPVSGKTVLDHAATLPPEERGGYLIRAAKHFVNTVDSAIKYDALPVDMQTFVESPKFLDRRNIVYPAVMAELIEMNSGKYVESVLTGGIGSGKTTAALLTMAYQIYILSCMTDPHAEFGLDPASEILTVFQSLNATVAKENDYTRFREMIKGSRYFQEFFPFDPSLESQMVFPRRILVRSLTGSVHAAIGANVMNALIDEINFMKIIEDSKANKDGGEFNQALEMYNGLVRRRKSRFMNKGRLPGMVCIVSSKRYPGEFTDMKMAEAKKELRETGKTSIFVYDKTVYDIKPPGTFRPERWRLFIGDISRKPRIMDDNEETRPEDQHLIRLVPYEYKAEFEHDLLSAIRDIAGCSTFAMNPFLINTEAVAKAFGMRQSILSLDQTDFVTSRPAIFPNRIQKPKEPRMAHVDLAVTGDSAGVAVGWVEGFTEVKHGEHTELMPKINFDFILEVKPPRNGEIEFESIRRLFYKLTELGMNLKWISFDTYQSRDSMQLLRQKGYVTGTQSMDVDSTPYDVLKTAIYDGRIVAPAHDHARTELIRLERDPQKGLIDHPPDFSKDCADAMAGVVYGLTYRREIWAKFGISMRDILAKVAAKIAAKDNKSEAARQAGLHRHTAHIDIIGAQGGAAI
jgi:hypothetical protein